MPTNAGGKKLTNAKIASLDGWRGKMLTEIRDLVWEADPEVVEEWKPMGYPAWSHTGIYAVATVRDDLVTVSFAHGSKLADPNRLFNNAPNHDTWWSIELHEHDAIDDIGFKGLVEQAVAYNIKNKPSYIKDVAGPIYLSGGNPQIPKGDGDAPVQAYIALMPGWKRKLGTELDQLIEHLVPDVQKAMRWNSPFYGVEGQGWFLSYHVFDKYLKITFLNGTTLNPIPSGGGKDPDSRWINIFENAFDADQMSDWIRQSAAVPGWDGF